jgi:hypothetical protein
VKALAGLKNLNSKRKKANETPADEPISLAGVFFFYVFCCPYNHFLHDI